MGGTSGELRPTESNPGWGTLPAEQPLWWCWLRYLLYFNLPSFCTCLFCVLSCFVQHILLDLCRNTSSDSSKLLLCPVQVVHAQSVVLEWRLYPSGGPSVESQNQQDSPLPLPWWASATVHIDNPQISYTAKVNTSTLSTPAYRYTKGIAYTGEYDCG